MKPLARTFAIGALLIAVCLRGPVAQTVVSGGGNALNQALQAASHGDVLYVQSGHYAAFHTSLGVSIVCAPTVSFSGIFGGVASVDGLPAGRVFAMCGGTTVATDFAVNVSVTNCRGAVLFDGLTTTAGRDCTIQSSTAVSFHGCRLHGPVAIDARVVFSDCTCVGHGIGETILATRSELFFAGGRADGPSWHPTLSAPARAAVRLTGSSLVVAGDGSTTLAAGVGPSNPPAVFGDAASSVIVAPRARLLSSAPSVVVAGRVTTRDTPAVHLGSLRRFWSSRVDISSGPGALTATFLDRVRGPTNLPLGLVWVAPSAIVLDVGPVPPSGVRSVLANGGTLPLGVSLTLQAASLLTTGELVLSPPTLVVAHQ